MCIISKVKWTGEEKITALKRTILFNDISEEDLLELLHTTQIVNLMSHQVLFSAGEACEGLYTVLEGRTRAIRHGADGREQVIHEDGPSSTFPEVAVFDDGPYPSTVIANEDSTLILIPKASLLRFCLQHPSVAMSALRVISKRLRKATGMVEDLSLKGVSQRLAEYLLEQTRAGREKTVNLELGHSNQDIADIIGTVREVVSRAFTKLQRKGWIKKAGRSVEILDPEALENHVIGGQE